MRACLWYTVFFFSIYTSFCSADTLEQCQRKLNEINEITDLARQQIDDLQEIRENKARLIDRYKLKIDLLEKRVAALQRGDEISSEMLQLLEENQKICLATESQAYDLMQKIMLDYRDAVARATRPWFLDPSFYGGLLLGALLVAAF